MKKFTTMALIFLVTTVLSIGSSSVFAQDQSAMTPAATTTSSTTAAGDSMKFQSKKAKILQYIGDRLTKIQKIQSCVQSSTDMKSLQACKPHDDKKHWKKNMKS